MSLENKVAIVTGSSSGIGAAIAILFSKEGANVAIVGRNEKKLKDVFEQCEKVGGKPLIIAADVTKDEDVKKIIDMTVSQFGKLDILVNNAGASTLSSIMAENALQEFDRMIKLNLRSVVYLTNLAGPHLVATGGNIVNISSIAGLCVRTENCFAYASAKAGLDHFTRCVALDFASKGVRCNVVSPGPVKTDIFKNAGISTMQEDAGWEMLKNSTPLQRVSDSEEIADLALFLASHKARGITGSIFVSDNGSILRGNAGNNNSLVEKQKN